MGEFAFAVSRFAEQTKNLEIVVLRKIAIDCFTQIVMNTPVDEGTARGNWMPTTESPSSETTETKDPSGSIAIARIRAITGRWVPTDTRYAYLTNNLPYIQRLNDGWSKQAPKNFVEQVIANQLGIVEASV